MMPDNTIHRKRRGKVHQMGHDVVDGFCNAVRAVRISDTALGVVVFIVVLSSVWTILSVITG